MWKGRKNRNQMCFYQEQQSGGRQSCVIELYCTFDLGKIYKTCKVILSRFISYWMHQVIIQSPRSLPCWRVLNRVLASVTIPRWRSFAVCRKKFSSSDYNPQWAAYKVYIGNSWAVSVKKPDWCTSRSVHSCSCRSGWPTCPLPLYILWRSETPRVKIFFFCVFLCDFEFEEEKCYQLRESSLACRHSSALWSSAFLQMPSTLSFWSPLKTTSNTSISLFFFYFCGEYCVTQLN